MGSKKYAVRWTAVIRNATKAFFDIQEHDSGLDQGIKVGKTATNRGIYALADYWLMALSGTFIILMDVTFSYGLFALFILMWAFDIAVAALFIVAWRRTGHDITVGESYRRAADSIHSDSKLAGVIAFSLVVIKATFWDGPEQIIIFFHKELKSEHRMAIALLVLTAIQSAIWTPIYILGYEGVGQLFELIVSKL